MSHPASWLHLSFCGHWLYWFRLNNSVAQAWCLTISTCLWLRLLAFLPMVTDKQTNRLQQDLISSGSSFMTMRSGCKFFWIFSEVKQTDKQTNKQIATGLHFIRLLLHDNEVNKQTNKQTKRLRQDHLISLRFLLHDNEVRMILQQQSGCMWRLGPGGTTDCYQGLIFLQKTARREAGAPNHAATD